MGLHATLTSNAEQTSLGQTRLRKQIFSLLERYDTLVTQANEHYKACCQEAEQQNLKKAETASYALFQEILKERQEMASVIQHTGKPSVIAAMAEDMGISLEMLNKDSRAYDREKSFEPREEDHEGKPIFSVPAETRTDKGQRTLIPADDPFLAKREAFEKSRFALNQEWCEKFHFYQTYKRFPNPDELADTWWQAERLTAIEGRLFHRNQLNGVSTYIPDLSQKARQEFLKNTDITPEVKETIKIAHLKENQIVQVEQHILFHRDKTGEDTTIARIQEIIEAIKIHAESRDNSKEIDDSSLLSKPYVHLMEQQEILADKTKHRSIEGGKEASGFLTHKDDKVASLNLQISRTVEFEQDCQQRDVDRGRGMSV